MKNVPAKNLADRRYAAKVIPDKRQEEARRALFKDLDDCCNAVDTFGEDELERYAAELRGKP